MPEEAVEPGAVLERARRIAPLFLEQQAETEERGFYSAEIHEALKEAGLYKVLLPRRFGGYELDFDCFFQIVMLFARSCPSSGWMYCLGVHHAVTAASVFPERAQDEMLGGGFFVAPHVTEPTGAARRAPADDGWSVNGTFRYASGMPYANYILAHTTIEDGAAGAAGEPLFFAVPAAAARVVDSPWNQTLGMKGGGSYTFVLDDAHVPDHLALPGKTEFSFDPADGSPGLDLHGNPMYCGYIHSSYMLQMAAVATGIALGALDEYDRLMAKNSPFLPIERSDDPDYQRWYGKAVCQLTACELAVRGWCVRWHEIAGPEGADAYADVCLGVSANEIIDSAWDAVEKILFRTAGPSSSATGSRIERYYRDLSTLRTHSGLSNGRLAGQVAITRRRFGREWEPGSWTPDYARRGREDADAAGP